MGLVNYKTQMMPCEEEDMIGKEVGHGRDTHWTDINSSLTIT